MEPSSPDANADERVPWWRYAIAATLGLSILGLTYVLFDPDLGTAVPLFQEFTCRGDLRVEAGNGYGEPFLRVPESGLRAQSFFGDEPRPAFFVVWRRDDGGEWTRHFDQVAQTGEHLFYVGSVVETTEVYVTAKDLDGAHCEGESGVLRATSDPPSSPASSASPSRP